MAAVVRADANQLQQIMLNLVRNAQEALGGRNGRIELALRRERAQLRGKDSDVAVLTVADDGRGLDLAQVKGTALRLELITPEAAERMGDSEALQLIFESGFSTSPMITSLSGRGVGLAIPGPYLRYGVLAHSANLPAGFEGWGFRADYARALAGAAGAGRVVGQRLAGALGLNLAHGQPETAQKSCHALGAGSG